MLKIIVKLVKAEDNLVWNKQRLNINEEENGCKRGKKLNFD